MVSQMLGTWDGFAFVADFMTPQNQGSGRWNLCRWGRSRPPRRNDFHQARSGGRHVDGSSLRSLTGERITGRIGVVDRKTAALSAVIFVGLKMDLR